MFQIYSILLVNWTKHVTDSFPGSIYFPPLRVLWGWGLEGGKQKREPVNKIASVIAVPCKADKFKLSP